MLSSTSLSHRTTHLPTSVQWLRKAACISTSRSCRGRSPAPSSPESHKRAPKPHARLPTALGCANGSSTVAAEVLVSEAWSLLKDFTQQEARGLAQSFLDTSQKRQRLKTAVLAIASAPWPAANYDPNATPPQVLLGVVSSDIRLAVRSLRDYTHALKLSFIPPESRVPDVAALHAIRGAVYVKYNAGSESAYASLYTGRDRGVLMTLGQQQIGHLPLGLFDEAMAAPLPQL